MKMITARLACAGRALLLLGALAACAQEPSGTAATGDQGASVSKAQVLDAKSDAALQALFEQVPETKLLADNAKGILIFPEIIKAGLIIGGQIGEGALRVNGASQGYYVSSGLSYGLQAGVQKFGYAMFFMSDADMSYLDESAGWEVGGAPSLVIADVGIARSLSTSSLRDGIYVFFFSQKGLMAGLGLQGTKITRFDPN